MDEQRIAAYYQLIKKLLQCPNGEEPRILNAHSELLDPGLLQTIIAFAKVFDNNGNKKRADFLTNLALQLGKIFGSHQLPIAIRKHTADILLEWGIEEFYINQCLVPILCWQQSLFIYKAIQERQGEADSLGNLGNAYFFLGQYEQANAYHEKSLAISQDLKNHQGEADSLGNLGNTYSFLG